MNNWPEISLLSVISIIINIILLLLVFFKPAINEIFKESWFNRKRERDDDIKRLVEFKTKFPAYNVQNVLLMISLAQMELARLTKKNVDPLIEENFQCSTKDSAEVRSSIVKFVDFLPRDLKTKFECYEKKYSEIITNIMQGDITKEDLLGFNEILATLSSECIKLTEAKIRDHLD